MASLNPFGEAKGCIEIDVAKVERADGFESILGGRGFIKIPLNVKNSSSWKEVHVRSYPGILLLPVNWIKMSPRAIAGYPRIHLVFTDAIYIALKDKKIVRFWFALHYDEHRHRSKNKGNEWMNLRHAEDLEKAFPRFSQRELEKV